MRRLVEQARDHAALAGAKRVERPRARFLRAVGMDRLGVMREGVEERRDADARDRAREGRDHERLAAPGGTGQTNVGAGPPTYVAAYGQLDLTASYKFFGDKLTTFVDILNLTNETTYVYGRSKNQPLYATQYGTRYNVGVRYKF